ncbi:MAG: hypothetical protein AAF602_03670 [Myxococcota bacterium]
MPTALVLPTLSTAGLAPVTLAVVTGLLVGVPAARASRGLLPAGRLADVHGTLVDLTVFGVLAATSAAVLAPLPTLLAVAAGVAMWTGAAWLGGRDAMLRDLLGVVAVVLAIGLATIGLFRDPWAVTLLTPQWDHLPHAAGSALVAGLWLGGLGAAQWVRPRRPGTARAPWGTAGLAVLTLMALCLWVAGSYERTTVLWPSDPAVGVVLTLAWLAAASRWLSMKKGALPWAAGGLLGTAWVALPGASVVGVLANGFLPIAIAATTGLTAVPERGSERVAIAVAAGLAVVAAGWGLAQARLADLGEAAWLATTVVASFWFIATTLVRRQVEVPA